MFDNLNDQKGGQQTNQQGQGTTPSFGQTRPFPSNPMRPAVPSNSSFPQATPAPVNRSGFNANSNKSVEDIFSDTEKGVKPPQFQPKPPANFSEDEISNQEGEKKINGRMIFIAGLAVVAVAILLGGWFAYKAWKSKGESAIITPIVNEPVNSEVKKIPEITPIKEKNTTAATTTQEQTAGNTPIVDTDGDGLTDEEEKKLGINPNSVDSDNDGLFDREEVRVYKTDPNKKDTDGDGFLDGAEVKGGYNPSGPGKLFTK